jgi:hypothetical protein
MRMPWTIALCGVWMLALSCGGDSGSLAPGQDPSLGPPGQSDLACPQDPDCFSSGTCTNGCPDYWVCTDGAAPSGGKRCWNPEPFPDDGTWSCQDSSGGTVCTSDHMPDGGAGAGWSCTEQEGTVTCTRDATYPDGGGASVWDCYAAGEFRVCDERGEAGEGEGEGEGPVEDNPDDGNEGSYDCWVDSNEFVTCDSGADSPDGGQDLCWDVDTSTADPEAVDQLGGGTVVYGSYVFGELNGVDAVYVRFAFTEAFVDNTYGVNKSDDWPHGHSFADLVESDKAAIQMTDGNGNVVLDFVLDYVSAAADAPSGYRTLGVSGGEGAMVTGDPSAILKVVTSIDRNLNQRGCVFLTDSPTPDQCPAWDKQVVYEVFVREDAFGAAGVGSPAIGQVHASPSKLGPSQNTAPVVAAECPAP